MRLLAVGDVVAGPGRSFLAEKLPLLKRKLGVDVAVVNGENAADGNGLTPGAAEHLFACGAHVITGGNHSFRRREVYDLYETCPEILRPANHHPSAPGRGVCVLDLGRARVAVINLQGTVYMDNLRCPFETAEEIVARLHDEGIRSIFVDFHAEATSEKRAMGFLLDGKVTAVFGTHTHVQTADAQILPGGTGYITDLGMTGPERSVLGVKPESALRKLRTKLPSRFEIADGPRSLCGCLFEFDPQSGRCLAAERIRVDEPDRNAERS